jgi:hypothetical protein
VLQISKYSRKDKKTYKMKCNTNNASTLVHKIWVQVFLFFVFGFLLFKKN